MKKTHRSKKIRMYECYQMLAEIKKLNKQVFTAKDVQKIYPDINILRINTMLRRLKDRKYILLKSTMHDANYSPYSRKVYLYELSNNTKKGGINRYERKGHKD